MSTGVQLPTPSAELQAVLGALPVAVLTSDTAGNVEFLNRAAEDLTERQRETAVGRPMNEVLPLGDETGGMPPESAAARCLRTNGAIGPFEATLLDSTGSPSRVVEVAAAPIRRREGPAIGVILIARDITQALQTARRLSDQATHDALTGLVNRTEFERRLTQALESASKEGSRHAIGFVDLDGFKRINDACGHYAGDELLRELSALLRQGMRARDTLARLGGDEFGILLEHCSPAKAVRLADEIRRTVADHSFTCRGKTFTISLSVGIVPIRNGNSSTTQLLCAADTACYQAKRQGGDRVQLSGIHNERDCARTLGWLDGTRGSAARTPATS
jgi:diguanylate cyclase (GGDEF)-like protein/PAS domain S-box-containing protein